MYLLPAALRRRRGLWNSFSRRARSDVRTDPDPKGIGALRRPGKSLIP
jgi:hypothetical protein